MSPVSAFGNALLVAGIDCLSGTLPPYNTTAWSSNRN